MKDIKVIVGLALSLTASVSLAQSQDFESYITNLAPQNQVMDYSVDNSYRTAIGNPPFDSQNDLTEIADADLVPPTGTILEDVSASDIVDIIADMESAVNPNATPSTTGQNKAIGLHSGMVLKKNTEWQFREVRNADRVFFPTHSNTTKNNISWYPDAVDTVGMRLTTGKFFMGSMPFTGVAKLDIPLANIKKDGEKIWFKARVENNTSPLDASKNYYQVFLVKAAIHEFFGYFDRANGEWKIKFVIDSSSVTDPEGELPSDHTAMNIKVYAKGYALQH